ncbi:MAG: type I polyketide synthase, partial [Planctomycetia bacterium]|nr:type I polyketide synthase [Planctomycetia bacterium]
SVILSGEITETFAAAGFLSPDGRCKAFDASADGYVRGEGAGVVVLKPLARALADGDPVYAVVRGSAVNQDGRSNGLTAPNREAQEAVLRAAYRNAGVAPGDVDYVEAHGTGTLLGDPIEASALAAVVGEGRSEGGACALGSVKTNVGHLEAASGIAGVIKVALAIDRGVIPASLHFREPNPHIPFDALPIRVQTESAPWPGRDRPRLAGVSSFGFGGTNAHAVLGSAPTRDAVAGSSAGRGPEARLIPLSARTPQALHALGRSYRDLLSGGDAPDLADVAHTAGTRRSHHEHRLAFVARTHPEAVARLDAFLDGETPSGRRPPSRRPRVAFVFSGQGSQWWGMGRGLAETEPVVRDVLDDLDRRFRPLLGWSIRDELGAGEAASRLEETGYAQPVVFALQVALAALWKAWGVEPDAVAGHSLGEVSAAFVAGALALDDAVLVVANRARLMQTTAGRGKTAAVALSASGAEREVAADPDRLALAAVNGPNASVISGEAGAVVGLVTRLRARGVFARLLAGHCAFHGPQMDPIRDELRASLAGLRPRRSTVPIVSTVTGGPIGGEELGPEYWARNVRETVRFADAASALAGGDFDAFLEVGPHPALGPATAEIASARGRPAAVLASLRRGGPGREDLLGSLATLYGLGFPVDWTGVITGGRFQRLPRYP